MLHSWKFAANALWEEALLVDALQPIDFTVIADWVMSQPQNVALEAIFAKDGLSATMFGIRITSLAKSEQAARIALLLSKTDAIKSEADFQKIAAEVFPEFALFSSELEALNIGIVSQWYSFGPELIWTQESNSPLSHAALKKKAPRFFEPTRNPAAVEFWYVRPTDHWYKIYVSSPYGDGYLIDPAKYDLAVNSLTDFKKDFCDQVP